MTPKKHLCSLNMFRHTTIFHPLPLALEHELVGSGDKLSRLQTVWAEL